MKAIFKCGGVAKMIKRSLSTPKVSGSNYREKQKNFETIDKSRDCGCTLAGKARNDPVDPWE